MSIGSGLAFSNQEATQETKLPLELTRNIRVAILSTLLHEGNGKQEARHVQYRMSISCLTLETKKVSDFRIFQILDYLLRLYQFGFLNLKIKNHKCSDLEFQTISHFRF